ncbi:MAG TPA: 30S ribosomal protein S15 [Candidatus Norongarragalinales archaeon]|nr:30S ribosomal protein S15 [Candidatus Norongarragalinales archaeon]
MARMHTRKKGKSRSRKPSFQSKWAKADKADLENVIEQLAKEGVPPAKIGLVLRDQHGVPEAKKVLGVSISAFLKQKNVLPQYPSDMIDLVRKAVRLRKHLVANKKDKDNRRHLHNIESKINRLVRYYRGKRLPQHWKYVPEEAALLVK